MGTQERGEGDRLLVKVSGAYHHDLAGNDEFLHTKLKWVRLVSS